MKRMNPRWGAAPLTVLLSLTAGWFLLPTASTKKFDKDSGTQNQKAFENYDIRYDPKVKEGVVSELREQLTPVEKDQIAKRDEELHEAEEKLGKRINNLRV